MMVLAALANILILVVSKDVLGAWVFNALWLGSLVSWGIVGGMTCLAALARTAKTLHRLGRWGWSRPRWWFEVSSAALGVGMLAVLPIGLALPAFDVAAVANCVDFIFLAVGIIVAVCFVGFFLAAIVGYAVSTVTGKRRSGNAYECVQPFFCQVGGICLVTYAGVNWPPQRLWPDAVWLTALGVVGLALLLGGVVFMLWQFEYKKPRWLRRYE